MGAVSVVLLAHNEAEVIENTVQGFYDLLVKDIPGSEIIVAEDGSQDGTQEILQKLTARIPALRVVHGKERKGYVQAFKDAMKLPKNEWILFCDCSGKHNPSDAKRMLALSQSYDLIVGYKNHRADPLYRVLLSRCFNGLVNRYFGVSFRDINCPLRLFRKDVFLKLAAEPWLEKALVNFEMSLRFKLSGYRVGQIAVEHFPRKNGESRGLPLKKIPKVVRETLRNFPRLKNRLTQASPQVSL